MTLREVLHAHIPVLDEASTVRDAVDKMDIYQLPALVVVDQNRAPIGVVTEGDLCRVISQEGRLVSLSEEPAFQFASKEPISARPSMEISDALHMMISQGLTVLPVVDDGRLSGIVLRVDLMQSMMMDAALKA
jgi:CBS domain-containing protein